MKLAYLFSRYAVPSQTFCDTEMRAMEARGHEIEIYSVSPPTTAFRHEPITRPRAPVFYAPHSRVLDRWELRARREGRWPDALIADHARAFGPEQEPARRARHALYFADLCRRRGVEHVHVHFAAHAVHTALFFKSFGGPPFSFTAHGQDFMTDLGNDDLLREMAARAAFVVAVSDWSRGVLREKCPASAERIVRVYNGLPEVWGKIAPVTTPAVPRLLSVGRLIEFKGFHVLIAACAELVRRGLDFTCDILGEGPWRPTLEALVAEHGLAGHVRLPGLCTQAEVHAAMAACDVFVLACILDRAGACDVLPTVILEAMAAARPVVSTTLAGVPELVVDGETGRLAPPGDVRALAEALEEMVRAPGLRERFGQAGRERLETQFRAESSARQLEAMFQETIASARGGQSHASLVSLPRLITDSPARLVYLLADCPEDTLESMPGKPPVRAEIIRLQERLAGEPGGEKLRVFSLRPPKRRLDPAAVAAYEKPPVAWWLAPVEFLPDGMVLEGGWRERADLVHAAESWREETAGSLNTEDYLLQARRALWLYGRLVEDGRVPAGAPLHLHAIGSGALLCAWILRRLAVERSGAVATLSFWLEPRASARELPGSAVRRLARDCAGGRVCGDTPLVTALGEWPFELETTGADRDGMDEGWISRLLRWSELGESQPHTVDLLDD